jgi:signal transduction histidine kinase
VLVTALAACGAITGLVVAALIANDARESGAYAVACVMIGGAMAVGGERAAGPRRTGPRSMGRAYDRESLESARREVREVRAVAHDLRAPLLTVSSYLDLVAQGAFGPVAPEAQAVLRQCASVAGRAQTVVETTLRGDADAAGDEGALRPVRLDAVLSEVMDALTASMRARGATVAVEGRLPVVLGDETALFRVLSNLIENSIKYTAPGVTPRISVRAERLHGGDVAVLVRDNGCGIHAEEARRVTQFGVRGSSAMATGHAGSGIGLATVARLVTRMGGALAIEGAVEGASEGAMGTTVRVTLRGA